jgi:predicted DNA-binding ArsR family transcriptional regulator
MEFKNAPGATPIDPDEAAGLVPVHITTQADLNAWEQSNILSGNRWASRQKKQDLLDEGFVRNLHHQMFNKTWKWAGTFRQSNKNIGVDWSQVSVKLSELLQNTRYQIEHQVFSEDEVADAVASLHPALEIGDTVFQDWYGASGYFGAALDNNGAAAFVPGDPVTDWRHLDLASARVDLSLNGNWQKSGVGAVAMGHPLTALTWVANWLRERGMGLQAGEFVSTGSCTGHFFVAPGDRLIADFGPLGKVDATFE